MEYNDKIRAVSKKTSLLESLKLLSDISETSLLYVYLDSYLPVINFLLGTESEEATMPSIKETISSLGDGVSLSAEGTNKITIDLDFTKMDLKFLGVDVSSIPNMSLTINLDPADANSLIEVTINDFTYNDYKGEVTVTLLSPTTNTPDGFGFNNDAGMVDLNDLPILMKVGLQIVDKRAYQMSGTLTAKTSGVVSWFMSVDINAKVNCYLRVGDYVDSDGLYSVDGYIEIITNMPNEGDSAFSTKKTTNHVRTTYFMVEEKNAYIYQDDAYDYSTRSSIFKSWTTTHIETHEYFKLTQEVMVRDALYYVLSYALGANDLYDQINSAINDSSGEDSSSTDVFSMFKYFKLLKEGTFQAKLNVYNLMDVYADINYNTETNVLTSIHAYTNFNIVIGAVSLDLNISNMNINSIDDIQAEMNMFDNFINGWSTNSITNNLAFRPDIESTGSEYIYKSSTKLL